MTDVRYEPVEFESVPGWSTDCVARALQVFAETADALCEDCRQPSPSPVVCALKDLANEAGRLVVRGVNAAAGRAFFEDRFVAHKVVHEGSDGLYTGYYEPELLAARQPDDRFCVALLKRPADLVNIVGDDMRGALGHDLTHARDVDGHLRPFATREEIECGALAGQRLEFLYLEDPVDAFFLHVQGSGLVIFPDGKRVRIGYDGKNGHPYTSVGKYVADNGWMAREDVTLDVLKAWLQEDPERGRRAMWQNRSFIFFKELGPAEDVRATGVKDIPLTKGRSLAVDTRYHQIGSPVFVSAPSIMHGDDDGLPFQRLMVAQDVGSAITGPERGDIYFGTGELAGYRAGITQHRGNMFVLVPKGVTA